MDLTHSMLASSWIFTCKTFICAAVNRGTQFQQCSAFVIQNIWDDFRRDYETCFLGVLALSFSTSSCESPNLYLDVIQLSVITVRKET